VTHADIGVTDPAQRAQLRAELDGLIAHVYGLTDAEFSHILSTFPLVDEAVKEAALQEYRRLAPDPALLALIAGGESAGVEFKEAARRNPYTGKDDGQKMSDNVVKAVAGLLNRSGGTLLIGVADDGTIKGVEVEYAIVNKSKANWDGYQLFLESLLKDKLSIANAFQYYQITPHTIEGKTVCQIRVQAATEPVYVDNRLYVRSGNQTLELQGPELVAYVNRRRERADDD
jgi:predicted HTH transcriptional regulator